MHKINHPNCVRLFEMFESKKSVYMVPPTNTYDNEYFL